MQYRKSIRTLIALIALVACAWGWHYWRQTYSEPAYTMTSLTKDMKTLCIGRILMDVPSGTTWEPKASWARIGGASISSRTGVDRAQFEALVESRWRELQDLKTDSGEIPLRVAERVSPGLDRVVFSYGFERIDGPDAFGVHGSRIFYDAHGFQWIDGTLVEFSPQLHGKEAIIDLMGRTRARRGDEFPNQPGLCLDGVFIAGYYAQAHTESTAWLLELPRGLRARIEVTQVGAPAKSYFERDRESLVAWADFIANAVKPGETYAGHHYRKRQRDVGGLVGDEEVSGEVEGSEKFGYSTDIGGLWEYPGDGPAALAPQIRITMGTPRFKTTYVPTPAGGFPRPEDTPDGPFAEEFFETWDAMIGSVRLRPVALTKAPRAEAPASRISPEQAERDRQRLDAFIAGLPPEAPEQAP